MNRIIHTVIGLQRQSTDAAPESPRLRTGDYKPPRDNFSMGAPPLFMIAMAGWGWWNKLLGQKPENEHAAPARRSAPPKPAPVDPRIMAKEFVERELVDKNQGTPVQVIESPKDLNAVYANGGGNAYKASLSYVLVHHAALGTQQFRVSRDLADVDMVRAGEIVLGAGTCLSLPTMGDLLIINGKSINFETLSDCIMTNNGRDDIGGMDKVFDHLESIGIINIRHEKSDYLADAYLGVVASSANMDSLSAEAYGATPETVAREKSLRAQNKGAPVYIIVAEQQFQALMKKKEPEKYIVVELANGGSEVRAACGRNREGSVTHRRMFLPREGEKAIGAGYWRYDPATSTLDVDGYSTTFPTENDGIATHEVAYPQHLASQNGLIAVMGFLRSAFPSLTITS